MRILVVGASSRLGRAVIPHLLARGWEVRAMTRHPSGLGDLAAQGAQVVQGDLRDRRSIERAVQGCTHVLSAAHALSGTGHNSSEAVDLRGISTLIDAAAHAQVEHFVFTSAWGSSSESPVDFMRYKAAGEVPAGQWPVMDHPASGSLHGILGDVDVGTGRARTARNAVRAWPESHKLRGRAGRGVFVVAALEDPAARGRVIDVGGPENISLREVVRVFERASGKSARVKVVPLWVLHAVAVLMRPFHRPLARLAALAVWQDTADMRLAPARTLAQDPVRLTSLREIAEWTSAQGTLQVDPARA
ncbi:SDR family oxidoreductase [Deinococcus malanensis]|uniref:SDR family oxidoreductase n=1 Tax=Deinococcus malanensis TaxID=1706855 RepID=UPI00363F4540